MTQRSFYRDDVSEMTVEGLSYRIGDLAAIGACATETTVNVDVLPKLQSLFEVIHDMATEAGEMAAAGERIRPTAVA